MQSSSSEIEIPVDRVVREFLKSTTPGFYGQTEIRIVLLPQALEGVHFVTSHQRKLRSTSGGDSTERAPATAEATERERNVTLQCRQLRDRLRLRAQTVRIVGHFQDGDLKQLEIVDVEESKA